MVRRHSVKSFFQNVAHMARYGCYTVKQADLREIRLAIVGLHWFRSVALPRKSLTCRRIHIP